MLGLVGSLLGSVAGGVMSLFGQNSANNAAAASTDKQMAFQENMSNTSFQRSSADMQAAGLNPAAMFGSASGASTPPGAQFTPKNTMEGMGNAVQGAVNSAMQQRVAEKTVDNLVEQNANLVTQRALTEAQTKAALAPLPGVEADSGLKVDRAGAIKKIPRSVYVPLVQGGFGAETMRPAGQLAAIGGAAAASAKSVGNSVAAPFVGMSGPTASSATEIGRQFESKWPRLRDSVSNWFNSATDPKRGYSTQYRSR